MVKTLEKLLIENEALRSRLNEVEEAIDAIRNGGVDAIMVAGSKGEQVYAISSADTPYRTFIEEMSDGAVTLTKDGTIVYCNSRFAAIVQAASDKVMGATIAQFLVRSDAEKLTSLLARPKQKEHIHLTVKLTNDLIIRFSIRRLPSYLQGDFYILIATDISDLKEKEKELEALVRKLENHINALRTLRIEGVTEHLDNIGIKNQLKATNAMLVKEMIKLNHLIEKLKHKKT